MHRIEQQLRDRLQQLSREWIDLGLPTREGVTRAAAELEEWKYSKQVQGLWSAAPRMVTATLDDGLGHGLALIERFARIMGITVDKIGLLQKPQAIVTRCLTVGPDFLGVTVLQLDSDDDLARVSQGLPTGTCLITGGAAFRFDPDMAIRCRVDYVAHNVAYFIDFILKWSPSARFANF